MGYPGQVTLSFTVLTYLRPVPQFSEVGSPLPLSITNFVFDKTQKQ